MTATPRIVGIGASAGGLIALEEFFGRVPRASGLAYLVVQHLDPTQPAVLAELLQRVTRMPVREAEDQLAVAPDCVYVIPPNTELSVRRGVLQLGQPAESRGMRLPVNVLFSSLAREQGTQAIGVVLSGMGSDGTLGLQAIKAVGGLTLVQDPASAQFDSMPRSAMAAHCADIVALPAEMPARIATFIARAAGAPLLAPELQAEAAAPASPEDPLRGILKLLQHKTRHDFSLYKPSTLYRRIERRMAIHSRSTLAEYEQFLRGNESEVELLFKELLIGVTNFFRDAPVWQYLQEIALAALLARRAGETRLRAWVVGCSTGEEAYTLAMVYTEVLQRLPEHAGCRLQIFASDLNPDAIASARVGCYPESISADVSQERLAQHFMPQESAWVIRKSIRDMVLFAQHDVVLDPPFTKLDILCCRNLLIYFDASLQRRLLPLFHYSLRPGGLLVLGSSETVGYSNRLFEPIEGKLRLYLRDNQALGRDAGFLLSSFPPLSRPSKEFVVTSSQPTPDTDALQTAADRVLLQVHAPPAVVVNSGGDIVYISGRTGKYLEPAAGKANWNFHAMVRESLRAPLADALARAVALHETVHLRGLPLGGAELQTVDVAVQPLQAPAALNGMVMIAFVDAPASRGPRRRRPANELEARHAAEVQQCQDEIHALREEAGASKEELQSANEELQSTNEELQSTNEELTTSKEEMQSMNEELQTVNTEMRNKLDDLALAQSDLRNLLNSTDIAMLFLDSLLNVRRFTERAAKIISLRESDIGRPLGDLTTSLQYPALLDDAHDTLRTLICSEKQIQTSDQRWFTVRIMPYRRLDNVIDGAVLTFVEITAAKVLESHLRQDLKA